LGTLGETITIDANELEEAPSHLSSNEAAALPLTGLTAWRATMTKSGNAKPGRNILVTGIGGGVAIMAVLFAVAAGANVYVSSGSEEKLKRAKELGAKGGVNYKEKDWDKKLLAMLPKERKQLDAIIDGAGSDIVEKGARMLKVCTTTVFALTRTYTFIGWRRHLHIRHDCISKDELHHARCPEEHRSPRIDHGIQEGIRGYGQIRQREEPQACYLTSV
jgi:NADPH:quinone reductase-like Zn-dependent oxidoreductase